jgi:hypothetical protein
MHIKKYHSAELLRSPESLVELTGLPLTIHEHTGGIERGHAESKRDQRTKDQAHSMKLHDSSAHRALTFYRKEWKEWHGGIAASHPTTSPGKIGKGSDRPQAQVAVQGTCKAKAKAKAGAKRRQGRHSRRKRKVSRRGAWMAVNAAGHMITAQDHADYTRMILDPSEAQRRDRIAAQMSRGPPRQRQRPSDYVFRKRREAKKRAELEWNPVVERQRLNEENRTKWTQDWQNLRLAKKQRSAAARKQRDAHAVKRVEHMKAWKNTSPLWQDHIQDLHARVGRPDTGVREWQWRPSVLTEVENQLPRIMPKESLERVLQWEHQHATIAGGFRSRKLATEIAREKRARSCNGCGRCV